MAVGLLCADIFYLKFILQNMHILEKIIKHKKTEVSEREARYPKRLLEESIYYKTPTVSLEKYLLRKDKVGIIAEFKKRSPSKKNINLYATVEKVSIGYMQAGASAISVLTDEHFFGGKNADLSEARKFNFCPILRKDFIINDYQLVEARSIGADAILLIAACLEKQQLHDLAQAARGLGLEVLMEVHNLRELDKLNEYVNIVGVNNRNLEDFTVSINTSKEIAPHIPDNFVKISENGISDPAAVMELKEVGYQGFLIGEHFMRSADPGKACREFIQTIKNECLIKQV